MSSFKEFLQKRLEDPDFKKEYDKISNSDTFFEKLSKISSESVNTSMEGRIVKYDEDFLYLDNGIKVAPPEGCKFDPYIIKHILEGED